MRGAPNLSRAVRGLGRADAGAIAILAPTAKDVGLDVAPQRGSAAGFRRALREGRRQGALGARIWHGSGRIPAGRPMVVVAAVAPSRRDATLAVESMLNALKGVATRRDASSE